MIPNDHTDLFRCEKILPPFIGEMGYEIRHFIGLVEPWLRSGWKIMTKRPEFYPPGTTLQNARIFEEINLLKKIQWPRNAFNNMC